MIKDYDRGGAWTKAILGLPAAEVHLCGHQCAVNLLERIASSIGEKVEVSLKHIESCTALKISQYHGGEGGGGKLLCLV